MSYNMGMMKKIVLGFALLFMGIVSMIRPAVIFAQVPILNVDFKAQDLTTGGDWLNPITVNAGDKMRFRAIVTNSGGATAFNVTVRMPLFNSTAKIQYPTFHILCMNASPPDAALQINLNSGAVIQYIPGSAVMIQSGVSQPISPDTDTVNITSQQIPVGNIAVGSSLTFEYNVSLGLISSGETAVATPAAAVAKGSAR